MDGVHRPLGVFVAGLMHETNSFSPIPTTMRSFAQDCAYWPPASDHRETALNFAGYGDAIRVISERGDLAIEGPCFWTQPSGPCSAELYVHLRGAIVDALVTAGSIDAVLLVLHGAMMADGTLDCEADLLAAVRGVVGDGVPLGAILDLHGNVGPGVLESGPILVGVKEYPHIDYAARVGELHAMLSDMARHDAQLTTSLRTIPVLSLQGTTEQPMRGLVDELVAAEGRDGIRSITLMHGFPWSDWEEAGAAVLVVSEDAPAAAVASTAERIAARYENVILGRPDDLLSIDNTLDAALSIPGPGPVIIADGSDNPGGGAACDSTFILQALVKRGIDNAALGMICDPQAAQLAAAAGVGARLPLRIGGKVGPMSGAPVDLEVEVIAVREDARQRFFSDRPNASLGLAVGLRAGGIALVVNSIRQQVFSPECFTELGIDVADKSIVVVKSSQHFRACFDPIARATIYCNAPGSMSRNLNALPYRNLQLVDDEGVFRTTRPIARASQLAR